MSDIPVLNMKDQFYIRGRGIVFCGEIDRKLPCGYKGEIIIQGGGGSKTRFKMEGFELFSVARPDNMTWEGEKVGVLVGQPSGYIGEVD